MASPDSTALQELENSEKGSRAASEYLQKHEFRQSLRGAQTTDQKSASAMKAVLSFRSLRRGARANFDAELSKGFDEDLETAASFAEAVRTLFTRRLATATLLAPRQAVAEPRRTPFSPRFSFAACCSAR